MAAVSSGNGVYVIAEAGVNHNGDGAMALDLIAAAHGAGANAVKFQTAKAENVIIESAPKAPYQNSTTDPSESQIAMLRRILLPYDAHFELVARTRELGIDFLSTPFDLESLAFLTGELGLATIKIPSGEVTNGPLVHAVGRSGQDVIMSTGMCTLDEVETALGVLALGYLGREGTGDGDAVREALSEGSQILTQKVTLLHCTTEYPAPIEETNLRAMNAMGERFGLRVGFSDHTEGIVAAIAAAACGASVIEKHFTLDRSLPGPDHKASLEPDMLAEMISAVRSVERCLGDSTKSPTGSERANMPIVRKSLVSLRPIRRGEAFTPENLGAKRPGTGISPMLYWEYLGRTAERDFAADELISR